MSRGKRLLFQALGLLMIGTGLYAAAWEGPHHLNLARDSEDWPLVQGTLTRSEVRRYKTRNRTSYRVVVEYVYLVDRQSYDNDDFWVGGLMPNSSERDEPDRYVREHPPGSTVPVYYDPDDPARSVLEVGGTRGAWKTVIGGSVLIALGVVSIVVGRWGMGRSSDNG